MTSGKYFLGLTAFALGGTLLFGFLGAVGLEVIWNWLWPPPRPRRGISMLPLVGGFWGLVGGFLAGVFTWAYVARSRDPSSKP